MKANSETLNYKVKLDSLQKSCLNAVSAQGCVQHVFNILSVFLVLQWSDPTIGEVPVKSQWFLFREKNWERGVDERFTEQNCEPTNVGTSRSPCASSAHRYGVHGQKAVLMVRYRWTGQSAEVPLMFPSFSVLLLGTFRIGSASKTYTFIHILSMFMFCVHIVHKVHVNVYAGRLLKNGLGGILQQTLNVRQKFACWPQDLNIYLLYTNVYTKFRNTTHKKKTTKNRAFFVCCCKLCCQVTFWIIWNGNICTCSVSSGVPVNTHRK